MHKKEYFILMTPNTERLLAGWTITFLLACSDVHKRLMPIYKHHKVTWACEVCKITVCSGKPWQEGTKKQYHLHVEIDQDKRFIDVF